MRQMPLGEADRIYTLCALDMGKVRAVAKGVRRMKSRLGGHLEPLTRVRVSVARGRNLDVVTEAHTICAYVGVRADLGRLSRGVYVAELVDGFATEDNGSRSMYGLLLETLWWMERTANLDLLLRWFEMHLLDCSGYMPELMDCVGCRSRLEPDDHFFSCSAGGVLCPGCRSGSEAALLPAAVNTMKVLRFVQRQRSFDAMDGLRVSVRAMGDAERLMRAYIRYVMEREIKSAKFMSLASSV